MNMLSSAERMQRGVVNQSRLLASTAPNPATVWQASVRDYVFAEIWECPGLDERARRWITLVGVANTAPDTPLNSHIHAALASGNVTGEELDEFVLQYAVYAGWPKASVVDSVVLRQRDRVARGLSFSD